MAKGESPVAANSTPTDVAYRPALLERAMERARQRTSSPGPEPGLLTPDPLPERSPDRSSGVLALTPTDTPRPRRDSRRRSPSRPPYLRRTPKTNKSTFLYRFYDANDVLLYVGITDNLAERTWSHSRASTWMEFAVRSTIERHAKRTEAEEMEVVAIRGEGPLFNLAYNDDKDADRRVVDYLIEHDRRDLLAPAVSRG